MPVKLRLRRLGRRKRPAWAVVAADNRRARDGRYIEDLGRYYPLEQPARTELDEGRVMHWLEQGAQPSDTVRSMLSKRGLLLAMDLRRQGKDAEEIREAVAEHRERHGEAASEEDVALTAEARRRQALDAERERVAELEAEEEKRRKEEEERKRREAEAKKKAEEEEQAAAEEADDDSAEGAEAEDDEASADDEAADDEAADDEAADDEAEDAQAAADAEDEDAADDEDDTDAEEADDEDDTDAEEADDEKDA